MRSRSNSALCGSPQNAEFERDILRDRVKAGIAQARKDGRPHGRPPTVAKYVSQIRALAKKGLNKSEISRRLRISPDFRAPIFGPAGTASPWRGP
jgi:DNA invertase Pin-like site-specific DNA recombinase